MINNIFIKKSLVYIWPHIVLLFLRKQSEKKLDYQNTPKHYDV